MFPHPKDGQHLPRDAASFSPKKGFWECRFGKRSNFPTLKKPQIVSEMESSFYILVLGRQKEYPNMHFPGGKLGSCFKRFRLEIFSDSTAVQLPANPNSSQKRFLFFPWENMGNFACLEKGNCIAGFRGFQLKFSWKFHGGWAGGTFTPAKVMGL